MSTRVDKQSPRQRRLSAALQRCSDDRRRRADGRDDKKVVGSTILSSCLMSRSKSRRKKAVTSPDLTLVSVSQALLVGEHLSFRRVATILGVRQSAVSRRVRELEDELGVSLFERHHAVSGSRMLVPDSCKRRVRRFFNSITLLRQRQPRAAVRSAGSVSVLCHPWQRVICAN